MTSKPFGSSKSLGKTLPDKLALLTKMKHFTLDGAGVAAESLPK